MTKRLQVNRISNASCLIGNQKVCIRRNLIDLIWEKMCRFCHLSFLRSLIRYGSQLLFIRMIWSHWKNCLDINRIWKCLWVIRIMVMKIMFSCLGNMLWIWKWHLTIWFKRSRMHSLNWSHLGVKISFWRLDILAVVKAQCSILYFLDPRYWSWLFWKRRLTLVFLDSLKRLKWFLGGSLNLMKKAWKIKIISR